MKRGGSSFTDRDIHRHLRHQGFANPEGEWFKCSLNDLRKAIWEVKTGKRTEENRVLTFSMRTEQEEAVNKSIAYFKSFYEEKRKWVLSGAEVPHFLWIAKMRFG